MIQTINVNDIIGNKYGKLLVLGLERKERYFFNNNKNANWQYFYRCKCDCGNETIVLRNHLLSKKHPTTMCRECAHKIQSEKVKKHGYNKTRIHRIYWSMKMRCNSEKHPRYHRYGGRGIKVCEEWAQNFASFLEWAMKSGYEEHLTLDRKNNDLGYCPENCRWATYKEQANNRSSGKKRCKDVLSVG